MNISRTAVTVAIAVPAGMMLAVISHGIVHTGADTLDPAAAAIGITTTAAALGSAAWYGVKAGIELHAETARTRRHRRVHPVPAPPIPARPRSGPGPEGMRRRPATVAPGDVIDQPHRDVATAEEHQALADAVAAEREQQPPRVDPYFVPGAVDADLLAGRAEETHTYAAGDWEDLYAHTIAALGSDARRYVSTTTAPPAAP
jgi:hypothetical protein